MFLVGAGGGTATPQKPFLQIGKQEAKTARRQEQKGPPGGWNVQRHPTDAPRMKAAQS